ncbi:MAG: wax ester/triacylglycerol synthase family O-acyltransferase [Acidobacteriota bacterium]|nr:wax ester/triacylglycerol synthase family O-acyltransferase [Acidobacteriota bacterium]
MTPMAHPDRLSALDSAFLHLESAGPSHMHVASVMIFAGEAPTLQELVAHVQSRLHLVPRYRQRLAFVPLGQGRPVWVDDPHFNPYYHIRSTALPAPADNAALKSLAGRVFSERLERHRPLWELWLVERLARKRFAIIAKAHHALVDGISGVDITTVLLDATADPEDRWGRAALRRSWVAKPLPSPVKLLGEALVERATLPNEMARGASALARRPRKALVRMREALSEVRAFAWAGIGSPAPPSPFNVDIGLHRRYTFLDGDLERFREIKATLGGTINDAVLTVVALALGGYLRAAGHPTDGLVLRAMVPVSVRVQAERGALGNRVAAMWAPLPVGVSDPRRCHAEVRDAMRELKRSGQAVGAQVITNLAGFAPPTILSQAARLQARQRYFNLVVTNVPGPQFPLYMLGHQLVALYPVLPLAQRQALGIAVMSYNGKLGFGLLGDYDALPDIESIAVRLRRAISALARAAAAPGPGEQGRPPGRNPPRARKPARTPLRATG